MERHLSPKYHIVLTAKSSRILHQSSSTDHIESIEIKMVRKSWLTAKTSANLNHYSWKTISLVTSQVVINKNALAIILNKAELDLKKIESTNLRISVKIYPRKIKVNRVSWLSHS